MKAAVIYYRILGKKKRFRTVILMTSPTDNLTLSEVVSNGFKIQAVYPSIYFEVENEKEEHFLASSSLTNFLLRKYCPDKGV